MDIRETAKSMGQTQDEKLLLSNFCQKIDNAENGVPQSTKFLTTAEQSALAMFISATFTQNTALMGGVDFAERKICIVCPNYTTPQDTVWDFLTVLRCAKSKHDTLQHKDYLGALMSLGIKRELIGDIFVGEHGADIVVMRSTAPFLLLNFEKAGKKSLSLSEISPAEILTPTDDAPTEFDTVASLRLDAFLAAVFNLSRSAAADEIKKGKIFVNSILIQSGDKELTVGDSVTFRGSGKVLLTSQNGTSKKGKLKIEYKKYAR